MFFQCPVSKVVDVIKFDKTFIKFNNRKRVMFLFFWEAFVSLSFIKQRFAMGTYFYLVLSMVSG